MDSRIILFLCTGNYYRSRFAEEYFNHLATDAGRDWVAVSAGLAEEITELRNPGPVSRHTVEELQRLGVRAAGLERYPRSVLEDDFTTAGRVIALSLKEHRPMVEQRFPSWLDRTEFWQVEDVQFEAVDTALGTIRREVENLVRVLEGARVGA